MKTNQKFKFIDLFAGIGGFRIALESFGGDCVYSSEWDKQSQKTYEANFGETPDGDITKVNEIDIPKHDILCAGFPCQAFSISGKQRGFADTRGTLFFDVARIAKYHKPKVLFLENVRNFVKHDGGKTLEVVMETLNDIGYNAFYKVLNASNYGAVTSRERVYIIAFRKDLGFSGFDYPKGLISNASVSDILEVTVDPKYYIVRDDIFLRPVQSEVLPETITRRPVQVGHINKGGQGERIYSPFGHAITLSAHGGGAAAKTGAYLIDGRIRKLTPRECARIMGFPDSYIIPVSDSQAYKQFGNSVAIPVLKNIFQQIIDTNLLWATGIDTHNNLVQVSQKVALTTSTK